ERSSLVEREGAALGGSGQDLPRGEQCVLPLGRREHREMCHPPMLLGIVVNGRGAQLSGGASRISSWTWGRPLRRARLSGPLPSVPSVPANPPFSWSDAISARSASSLTTRRCRASLSSVT